MQTTSSFNLPNDIIMEILPYCDNLNDISLINKKLLNIVNLYLLKRCEDSNNELIKIYPRLKATSDHKTNKNAQPTRLFMRLVHCLYNRAELLGCNAPCKPKTLVRSDRTQWELNNFKDFVATIHKEESILEKLSYILKIEFPDETSKSFSSDAFELQKFLKANIKVRFKAENFQKPDFLKSLNTLTPQAREYVISHPDATYSVLSIMKNLPQQKPVAQFMGRAARII